MPGSPLPRLCLVALAALPVATTSAAAQPVATDAAGAPEFPRPARSWGGTVRSGPGKTDARIAALREGEPVTILGRSENAWNGFPWFHIRYGANRTGYQWGGILCPVGTALPGTYKVCQTKGAMLAATAPAHVHDLGAVPGAIAQPEGKRSFASQIGGTPDTGPLGTPLPAGLTRDAVLRLVAPEADPKRVTLVGAKPWPHLANGYVALVCAAHDPADLPPAGAPPGCDSNPDVYLGVLRMPPGGTPHLVARTPKGFVLNSDWAPPAGAPILLPSIAPEGADTWPAGRSDNSVSGFDLAPYRIAPGTYAFGLRSDQTEGYSGGYATFETLHLFQIDGTTLRRILAQPIYVMKMTAGDWNKDGTRQHDVSEDRLVLAVLPHLVAGHYELRVAELGKQPRSAILRWNPARQVYWVPGE
ncbi:SH3 domain-containing protein [Solirhodobacter olei]|uniref:SH3 domain-containing protein n=1 Tax=Solirhodobacter olei TaxID=2493082 RepID=UPI0013E4021E|nr:SH3 domain-containing protein [Solirhodobacter olei]